MPGSANVNGWYGSTVVRSNRALAERLAGLTESHGILGNAGRTAIGKTNFCCCVHSHHELLAPQARRIAPFVCATLCEATLNYEEIFSSRQASMYAHGCIPPSLSRTIAALNGPSTAAVRCDEQGYERNFSNVWMWLRFVGNSEAVLNFLTFVSGICGYQHARKTQPDTRAAISAAAACERESCHSLASCSKRNKLSSIFSALFNLATFPLPELCARVCCRASLSKPL